MLIFSERGKIMKRFILLAAFIIFGTASIHIKAAESELMAKCMVPSFKTSYKNSKTIFVGKVLSIRKEDNYKILTFQVDKYWKNSVKKIVEVKHYEAYNYEVWLQTDGKYLVYAYGDGDGNLFDGKCSFTKKYSDAKSDLKKLGKSKKPH